MECHYRAGTESIETVTQASSIMQIYCVSLFPIRFYINKFTTSVVKNDVFILQRETVKIIWCFGQRVGLIELHNSRFLTLIKILLLLKR